MKRLLFVLFMLLACATAWTQKVTLSLHDETLASALRLIDHAQQERRIVFVLNDLDSIRVTRSIFNRDVLDAVNEVCEGHPILITECKTDILVEYIRPPVRLLPNATITRRQLHYDAEGYSVRPIRPGMTGHELLLLLPHLTAADDGLNLNGQEVKAYYLNGERLTNADELLKLPSEVIEEVRVNLRTQTIHVTLRNPSDGGYYGSLAAEADGYEASMENGFGGLWMWRRGKTSLYNRFDASLNDVSHAIKQYGLTPSTDPTGTSSDLAYLQNSRLNTNEHAFSNRFSLMHELAPHKAIGLSYYIAHHQGKANAQRDNDPGSIDFSGSNRHTDHELTLRYNATFGKQGTWVEALADYYSRHTSSENLSLYGAGVGTEMGEAPSLSMWKLSVELHHPFSQRLTLHFSNDLRYLFSHYDPTLFLSNFNGSPAFLHEMDQYGMMWKCSIGASARWQRLRLESGVALQVNTAQQEITQPQNTSELVNGYDYRQCGVNPYLQLYVPIDEQQRHVLTLSYQRDLDDIPYAAMSPAVRWSDAFNYSVGNRKLRSPDTQRFMVNASGWDGRMSLSVSYLTMHNEIFWQSAISSGQTDVYYTQPINLAPTRLWRLQAEGNLHPTPRWQMKLNALWQLRPEDTMVGDTHYHARHLYQQYACYNHVDYGQGWRLSLNATYVPTFHLFDRTYHSRHSLQGEVQKSLLAERLQCALTFELWNSDRRLDRQIGQARVSYQYSTSQPHIGLRAIWKFDGGRSVKIGTVEGAQHYNDIKDY